MIRLLIGITLFKALFHRRSPLRGLIVGGLIGFFAHRHFEQGEKPKLTTLADVTPGGKQENAEVPEEAPKRKGRSKKTAE